MSALGHKRTYAVQQLMSALPPIATAKADHLLHPLKADAYGANRHVCFGPIADISTNTGTFDAAPAQGTPIFDQAEGLALFRDRAIVAILFLWAAPYAAAWVRAAKLR
jgi:hypothetical protein